MQLRDYTYQIYLVKKYNHYQNILKIQEERMEVIQHITSKVKSKENDLAILASNIDRTKNQIEFIKNIFSSENINI